MAKFSGNEGIRAIPEDNTSPPIELYLTEELNSVTILNSLVPGDQVFTLSPGHGVTVGDFLEIYVEWDVGVQIIRRYMQLPVIVVVTDTITTGVPVDVNVDGTTIVSSTRTSAEMAVAASLGTPSTFRVGPPNGLSWDFTRIMIEMVLAGAPDDGLFGSLPALTNGMYFGFEGDEITRYLIHVKDNAGFRGTAFDVTYTTRSGGLGNWGMSVRKTFAGMDKWGVAVRANGPTNDCLIAVIQDDISGIAQFRTKVMGHVFR